MEETSTAISKFLNEQLHQGQKRIGECAQVLEVEQGLWWAAIYIWDDEFNDSKVLARWLYKLGAANILITHVLYDSENGDRDGKCFDGVRAWQASFSVNTFKRIETANAVA